MLIFLSAALAGDEAAAAPAAEPTPAGEQAPAAESAPPVALPDAAPLPEPDAALAPAPRVQRWNVQLNLSGVILDPESAVPVVSETGVTAVGGSVSYAVTPWLHPFVGFNALRTGMGHGNAGMLELDAYEDEEIYSSSPFLNTAYEQQQLALGARGELAVHSMVGLFVLAQGQATFGTLRFDDDPDVDDNLGQFEASGATAGVTGSAGLTAYAPTGSDVSVSFSAEGGYEWNAPLQIGDVATLDISGVFIRVGVGARF